MAGVDQTDCNFRPVFLSQPSGSFQWNLIPHKMDSRLEAANGENITKKSAKELPCDSLSETKCRKTCSRDPWNPFTGNKSDRSTLDLPFGTTWEKTGKDLECLRSLLRSFTEGEREEHI